MHADDFRVDRYGVVSGLRDGGYSDDMTLAAISGIEQISNIIIFLMAGHFIDSELFIYTNHDFVVAVQITHFLHNSEPLFLPIWCEHAKALK